MLALMCFVQESVSYIASSTSLTLAAKRRVTAIVWQFLSVRPLQPSFAKWYKGIGILCSIKEEWSC